MDKQQQYEAEKQKIQAMHLPPKEYEQKIREATRRLKL